MDPRTTLRRLIPLLAGIALVVGCEQQAEPEAIDLDTQPTQTFFDYTTRQTREAVTEWELYGRVAEQYEGESVMHLTGVRMVFFEEGERDAVLTSDTGEVDQDTQNTVARGNVEVVTEDGRRLESEVLYWDPERELIHTHLFFTFVDGDKVVTGVGLETDPDLVNVNVTRQVEGTTVGETTSPDDEGR